MIFKLNLVVAGLGASRKITLRRMSSDLLIGLMPSDNKLLPEPMLNQTYFALSHHYAIIFQSI